MKLFAAAALALFAAPVFASTSGFVIDFEKNWDYANGDVNAYYNGGTAADGTSGTNFGVSFVGLSGLSNDPAFPAYSGAPSMLGVAYAHTFAPTDMAFMNVAAGVDRPLSFFYSSPTAITGGIKAYSGLNGTGTLLGSFDLLGNAPNGFDTWTQATFSFSGIAGSFDLTSAANVAGFDNISVSVSPIPEPSTFLMMLVGGAVLLRQVGRRRS